MYKTEKPFTSQLLPTVGMQSPGELAFMLFSKSPTFVVPKYLRVVENEVSYHDTEASTTNRVGSFQVISSSILSNF